jgi:hypothetical protein
MARPRKDETMETISVRLPSSIMEDVDACTEKLRADTPLLTVTRTETIRFLIQVGLREVARKGVRLK